MSNVQTVVSDLLKAISGICDLEDSTQKAFSEVMLPILQTALSASASSGSGDGTKIKLGKGKGGSKKSSKPKEEKLASKNGYHFFVAAKMGEVKAAGVGAKERMGKIGGMWKALNDDTRKPYKEMAERYNAHVAKEMQSPDWKARKEAIQAAANAVANQGAPVAVSADDLEDVEDTSTVVTTATTSTAPTQAPVQSTASAQVSSATPAATSAAVPAATPVKRRAAKKP